MVFVTKQLVLSKKVANDKHWPFGCKIAKYAWKRLICRISNWSRFFSLFWQISRIEAKNLDRFRRKKQQLDGICHKTACFKQKANKWPTLTFSVQNRKVRLKTTKLSFEVQTRKVRFKTANLSIFRIEVASFLYFGGFQVYKRKINLWIVFVVKRNN